MAKAKRVEKVRKPKVEIRLTLTEQEAEALAALLGEGVSWSESDVDIEQIYNVLEDSVSAWGYSAQPAKMFAPLLAVVKDA